MSRYDPSHRARLIAEIVERVGAGETLKAICREAGKPCVARVMVWAKEDAAFGTALAAARRGAEWRRWLAFDEGVAKAFLARVAAGERLQDLFRAPGMPSRKTYRYWLGTQAEFQEALWRLGRMGRGRYPGRAGTGNPRWRAWDEATADRITLAVMRGAGLRRLLASDPTLPGAQVVNRWRREQPDWDAGLRAAMRTGRLARGLAASRCTPELMEAISHRVIFGETLCSLAREPDMPSEMTLYKWAGRRPELRRRLERARETREIYLTDLMLEQGRKGSQNLQAKIDRLVARREREGR